MLKKVDLEASHPSVKDDFEPVRKLTLKQRLRLYVGGTCFIGLGAYIIWKTIVIVLGLLIESREVSTWNGWPEINYIFVFGDSYSDVGYDVEGEHPNALNPIGNPEYPGFTTASGPNWVDYLITENNQSLILAHDYAVSGNTVQGVDIQVNEKFLPYAGQKPDWAPWTDRNSLFLTWIGINDIQWQFDPSTELTRLFELQESLYQAGARNFVFLTVPPFDRAPVSADKPDRKSHIARWNYRLKDFVTIFRYHHADAFVQIYDTMDIFNTVFHNPAKYGFRDATRICQTGECVWNDGIHPAFSMHKLIAEDLAKFLKSIGKWELFG